jgi:MFS family permease
MENELTLKFQQVRALPREECTGALAVSLGYGMLAPLVPVLKASGVSDAAIAVLMSAYPVAKAVGYAASMNRSIRSLAPSWVMIGAALAYVAMSITGSIAAFSVARIIEGAAFGWYMAVMSTILADGRAHQGERLAWLNAASSAGVLLGPLVIAATDLAGHAQSAFLLAAAASICGAVLLRGHRPATSVTGGSPGHLRHLMRPSAMIVIGLFVLFDFTYGYLSFALPIAFLQGYGAAASGVTAAVFSVGFLVFTFTMPAFGRLADHYAPARLVLGALLGIALLFGAAGMFRSTQAVLVAVMILEYVCASAAYAAALALLGRMADGAFAASGMVQSIGMAAGPLAAAWMIAQSNIPGALIALGLLYLLAALGMAALWPMALQMPAQKSD